MDSPEYEEMSFEELRSKFFNLLSTDWMLFKDLKQGPDESVEVFLIKVRKAFTLATRNNEPSRVYLNMELVRQAVEGLCNKTMQREWWGLRILPSPLPGKR